MNLIMFNNYLKNLKVKMRNYNNNQTLKIKNMIIYNNNFKNYQ